MLPYVLGGEVLAVRCVRPPLEQGIAGRKEEFFVGIMCVPNATGLWQVTDIRNNGILKVK